MFLRLLLLYSPQIVLRLFINVLQSSRVKQSRQKESISKFKGESHARLKTTPLNAVFLSLGFLSSFDVFADATRTPALLIHVGERDARKTITCVYETTRKTTTRLGKQRAQARVLGFLVPTVQRDESVKNPSLERGGISRVVRRENRPLRGDEVYLGKRRGIYVREDDPTELV